MGPFAASGIEFIEGYLATARAVAIKLSDLLVSS